MKLTISVDLDDDEKKQLAEILSCEPSELADKLPDYMNAAAQEYLDMFLGKKVFSRASDIHEYRLLLLAEKASDRNLPDEAKVSTLFQTTQSASRTLIRSVMSKYQYRLKRTLILSVDEILKNATQPKGNKSLYKVTVSNKNLVSYMNTVLLSLDKNEKAITKVAGTLATYEMQASAYKLLLEFCG